MKPSGIILSTTCVLLFGSTALGASPAITSEPQDRTVFAGEETSLDVSATGGSLVFDWYEGEAGDTSQLVWSQWGPMEMPPPWPSPDSRYTTPPLPATTKYWVRVWNSAGAATSRTVIVTVQPYQTPNITSEPQDSTISVGEETSLNISATGGGLVFDWYEGVAGDASKMLQSESGSTYSSYSTQPLAVTMQYWVRVWNSAGAVTSRTAMITVQPYQTPNITSEPQDSTNFVGERTSLNISATGGSLVFDWYEGVAGDASKLLQSSSGNTYSSYSTPPLAVTMQYWVRVWNTAGAATSRTVIVTVQPYQTPNITSEPQDSTNFVGERTSLNIWATGGGLVFDWYEGEAGDASRLVWRQSGSTYSSYSTPPLVVTTQYWVRVWNSAGAATSRTAVITVQPYQTPNITIEPQDSTIFVGEETWMYILATGGGLVFDWYEGEAGDASKLLQRQSGSTYSRYSTPPLVATTQYWVRVWNTAGAATSRIMVVTVQSYQTPTITSDPQDCTVYAGEGTSLDVSASGGGLVFDWYEGEAGDTSRLVWSQWGPMEVPPPPPSPDSRYTTPPLPATTKYWVRVWNSAGATTSETATITVTVLQITGLSTSEDGLDMRWPTLTGVSYRVEQATTWGAWSNTESSCVGDGLDATNKIPWSLIGNQGYYRVRASR